MAAKKGKKKWIILIAVVLVIALVAGLAIVGLSGSQEQGPGGSVERITKRTIANSISANGSVEAANKENVTGGSYGMKVESVKVKEGDLIAAGDIICVFDTEDIDEQIKTTQDNIKETKADQKEQLADYDEQIAERKETNAKNLEEAKANLATAEEDLAKAKDSLAQKEKEYADYLANGGSATDINAIQMESVIENKKSSVETVQSRVDSYKSRVESLEETDTQSLEDARDSYKEQSDATLESYEERLESLQEQKADATIYAGISGVLTAVNVTEGATFNGGTIASIEGIDQFIVEAQVEEYDVADVAVGMKVLVKTDATRDTEIEGVITYVAPRATNSGDSSMSGLAGLMGGSMDTSSLTGGSGSATYLVKIELKEQNERLRLGMNAKTSIITSERVDVWSVPYDAVYTREDGSSYVVQVTGKDEEGNYITEELDVTIGLQGTYYVEVISDAITETTEIFIPDAQGNSSIEELLNMMGAAAGI